MLLAVALLAPHGWSAPFSTISAPIVHTRSSQPFMELKAGDDVMVAGNGPVMLLAAKLAAIKGYSTTCALSPKELEQAARLVFTDVHPEGSLPISFVPIAGPDAEAAVIEACVAKAKGLILAFDGEMTIPESALKGSA